MPVPLPASPSPLHLLRDEQKARDMTKAFEKCLKISRRRERRERERGRAAASINLIVMLLRGRPAVRPSLRYQFRGRPRGTVGATDIVGEQAIWAPHPFLPPSLSIALSSFCSSEEGEFGAAKTSSLEEGEAAWTG